MKDLQLIDELLVVGRGRDEAPGVDFINVLLAAFMPPDPNSTKKTDSLIVFFALLGSARVKAAHKMLMKLTPDEEEGPAHQRRRLPEGVAAAASCATSPLSATEEPVEVCPPVSRHHNNNNTDEH